MNNIISDLVDRKWDNMIRYWVIYIILWVNIAFSEYKEIKMLDYIILTFVFCFFNCKEDSWKWNIMSQIQMSIKRECRIGNRNKCFLSVHLIV